MKDFSTIIQRRRRPSSSSKCWSYNWVSHRFPCGCWWQGRKTLNEYIPHVGWLVLFNCLKVCSAPALLTPTWLMLLSFFSSSLFISYIAFCPGLCPPCVGPGFHQPNSLARDNITRRELPFDWARTNSRCSFLS